jgi:hypothetical protein
LRRAQLEIGEEAAVEFIPSKNAADRFFGYVGEDCTKPKGEAIERRDFQLYRMISNDRLVGMLYLQKKRVGWFEKALVIAIQPRSFWEVDQRSLLRAVEENLSKVARAEGFEYVFLMNSRNQQSNRQDMLAAIATEGYPVLALRKPISGAVFDGKEFLVVWKKGQEIRPAPPTEVSVPSLAIEIEDESLEEEDEEIESLAPPKSEVLPEEEEEVLPPGLLPSSPKEVSIPLAERLRLLLEEEEDPLLRDHFQYMVQNRMAELFHQLSVRQRRRMMQAMSAGFLAEVNQAFQEAGVSSPFGLGSMGGPPPSDRRLVRIPPTALTRYGALVLRKNEMVAPDTLILKRRSLEAILSDPRITHQDRGWFEPTLKDKRKVVPSGEVVGAQGLNEMTLARGDEVSIQELFDFYNVIFYQGYQFRGYLRLLQNRGADIRPLAEIVGRLSENLGRGLEHLFTRRFPLALSVLQEADTQVTHFQQEMRRIAHTVGLEIDPMTGMIYPRQ